MTLNEPVLKAKFALKYGDDIVAEALRDFPLEAAMASQDGSVVEADPCDFIFEALERSLRPAFHRAPASEMEVQCEVAKILRTLGVAFRREAERAALGATSVVPDFAIPDLGLAIETKLAKRTRSESKIQRELAQVAAAYFTRWPQVIAVVYDSEGVIRDPRRMRAASEEMGLRVLVVKH